MENIALLGSKNNNEQHVSIKVDERIGYRGHNDINQNGLDNENKKLSIPTWDSINEHYEQRWLKEKELFQNQLKENFFALIERFACGKQELFQLVAPDRRVQDYIKAFLELFESGYAPHVGDVERLAGKKVRKLYVTLPNNYHA
tara:strand:- start:3821 stop:4252 length:432 start_codon:yes stop_codon:yes gene_type:complete